MSDTLGVNGQYQRSRNRPIWRSPALVVHPVQVNRDAIQSRTAGRTSYLAVAEALRDMTLDGTLEIGHRLPSESELCDTFGVSRTTLREALRILATEQLITTKRGVHGGSIITALAPADLAGSLQTSINHLVASDNCTTAELLETRELLEIPAARLAAERRTDAHLDQLRANRGSGAADATTLTAYSTFHTTILEAAGNRLVRALTEPVYSVLQIRYLNDHVDDQLAQTIAGDHGRILEAVAQRDPIAAADTMAAHLTHLRGTYERLDRAAHR